MIAFEIMAHHSCVVCSAPLMLKGLPQPLSVIAPDPYPTCLAVACRMVVSRRLEMSDACFRHYLKIQATYLRAHQERSRAAVERELRHDQENKRGWAILRACLPIDAPEPLQLLLPSGPRRSRKASTRRRTRYEAHLQYIVAEARKSWPGSEVTVSLTAAVPSSNIASPIPTGSETLSDASAKTASSAEAPPSSISSRLCGACGGGCCTLGAEHAYLTPAAIRALMDIRPWLSDRGIIDAYLDRLPRRSQNGSCINHTLEGCALPREMRSHTCNKFSCNSLQMLQHAQTGNVEIGAVFVIQRRLDHWKTQSCDGENPLISCAIISENRVRRIAVPPPEIAIQSHQSAIP